MNVNGLAASIELYLGEDLLRDSQGAFIPVQWKGYIASLKEYQGEVLQKSQLQSAFNEKYQRCQADATTLENTDWSGISAILQEIFSAFN